MIVNYAFKINLYSPDMKKKITQDMLVLCKLHLGLAKKKYSIIFSSVPDRPKLKSNS